MTPYFIIKRQILEKNASDYVTLIQCAIHIHTGKSWGLTTLLKEFRTLVKYSKNNASARRHMGRWQYSMYVTALANMVRVPTTPAVSKYEKS